MQPAKQLLYCAVLHLHPLLFAAAAAAAAVGAVAQVQDSGHHQA